MRRCAAAVLGGFLGFFSGLASLHAGEKRSIGSIAVTFHENGANRMKSENFYVVKESGLVRWQNFKNRDLAQENKSRKVYEVKTGETLPTAAKYVYEEKDALAATPLRRDFP